MSEAYEAAVAAEVRAWAARRSLNQVRLAEIMGENEIWVSRRLRGKVHITVEDLAKFATALECSIGALLPDLADVAAAVTLEQLDQVEPTTAQWFAPLATLAPVASAA